MSGYRENMGRCYLKPNGTVNEHSVPLKLNFSSAEKYCSTRGSHLISIRDMNENRYINGLTGERGYLLLGLQLVPNHKDKTHKSDAWKWMDGMPLNFTQWNNVNHDRNDADQCIFNRRFGNQSEWSKGSCSEPHEFVCYYNGSNDVNDALNRTTGQLEKCALKLNSTSLETLKRDNIIMFDKTISHLKESIQLLTEYQSSQKKTGTFIFSLMAFILSIFNFLLFITWNWLELKKRTNKKYGMRYYTSGSSVSRTSSYVRRNQITLPTDHGVSNYTQVPVVENELYQPISDTYHDANDTIIKSDSSMERSVDEKKVPLVAPETMNGNSSDSNAESINFCCNQPVSI